MLFGLFVLVTSIDYKCESRLQNDGLTTRVTKEHIQDNMVSVSNSYFFDLKALGEYTTSDGVGSAICLIHDTSSLIISHCTFLSCYSEGDGGAVHYRSSVGLCEQFYICADRCSCNGNRFKMRGQYASIDTQGNQLYVGVTIVKCAPDCGYRKSPIELISGNITIKNMNNSKNYCYSTSSIWIRESKRSEILFSSFVDCEASAYCCLHYTYGYNYLFDQYITNTNVIRQKQYSSGHGVVYLGWAYPPFCHFNGCVFIGNNGYLFYIRHSFGSIEVANSWIYHTSSLGYGNIINDASQIHSFDTPTLGIKFMNTFLCGADMELSFDCATPTQTIEATHDQTIINSPTETQQETADKTQNPTIKETVYQSPMMTFDETPSSTHEETLKKTIQETLMCTQTLDPTHFTKPTPSREQNNDKKHKFSFRLVFKIFIDYAKFKLLIDL